MVSHHGSRGNTNFELLELIDCSKFIVSANAKNKHYFPHKEAFARILANPARKIAEKISLIFNYGNSEIKNIFTKQEMEEYNFECLYPDINENGYIIQLS